MDGCEYLLLRGPDWLLKNGFSSDLAWEWNPRQTGGYNEPDLRGSRADRVVVSAEACASENPIGSIDTRMKVTLEKLNRMDGQKFYFVCTASMEARARTKITTSHWPVTVVQL